MNTEDLPRFPDLEEVLRGLSGTTQPQSEPYSNYTDPHRVVLISYKDYVTDTVTRMNPNARIVTGHVPDYYHRVSLFAGGWTEPFKDERHSDRDKFQDHLRRLVASAIDRYESQNIYLVSPPFREVANITSDVMSVTGYLFDQMEDSEQTTLALVLHDNGIKYYPGSDVDRIDRIIKVNKRGGLRNFDQRQLIKHASL